MSKEKSIGEKIFEDMPEEFKNKRPSKIISTKYSQQIDKYLRKLNIAHKNTANSKLIFK